MKNFEKLTDLEDSQLELRLFLSIWKLFFDLTFIRADYCSLLLSKVVILSFKRMFVLDVG
jgi:hypothetical protein